uniref:CUB domain-containing protein n=1 Tax=Panagrolaimus sp. ES5 TaxID=591445 RepID=A0AC34F151_9BILA
MTLKNTTDIIVNERSFQVYNQKTRCIISHPYYNSDNYIQIFIETTTEDAGVYISVVKNNVTKEDGGCRKWDYNSGVIWTNTLNTGYKNNMRCIFHLIIPKNSAVVVYTSIYSVEYEIDYINYYIEDEYLNKSLGIRFDDTELNIFRQNATFEFISDGSVNSYGFTLDFTYIGAKFFMCNFVLDIPINSLLSPEICPRH